MGKSWNSEGHSEHRIHNASYGLPIRSPRHGNKETLLFFLTSTPTHRAYIYFGFDTVSASLNFSLDRWHGVPVVMNSEVFSADTRNPSLTDNASP